MITKDFFGMMYQGSSVDRRGNVQEPYYRIPVGIQRLWDTRATETGFGEPPFDLSGLESQVNLAEFNGSEVMFTFGFSADPQFPPPAGALREESRNVPKPEYLESVIDAVLDFSMTRSAPRIRYFEGQNEPALKTEYWDGTPEELHDLEIMRYAKIKARQWNSVVISPSLNDLLEPSGQSFAERYCALMRKQPACDAIAFHLYADTVQSIHDQLAQLDRVTAGLGLPLYCTEFNGPWEAFDIMAAKGIRCVVLNGQQPPAPYSDPDLRDRWLVMVNRLTTIGPEAQRKGCNPFGFLRR